MAKRKWIALLVCSALLGGCTSPSDPGITEKPVQTVKPTPENTDIPEDIPEDIDADIFVTVKTDTDRKPISPYIYGINDFVADKDVTAYAVRQGGNRYTAYNWESNFSNAGSDWEHYSDTYLSKSKDPADCALTLAKTAAEKNIPYKMTTLQMAGYVSADGHGMVKEESAAPSDRFNEVIFAKNAAFDDTPDTSDAYVYMDEYVNYLVKKLGQGGINGYNLDNEPALWPGTHPRIHPAPAECAEIVEKSASLAAAVKAVDPSAEIFGPALYGVGAYNDFQSAPDWSDIKKAGYDWFVSYYLDQMASKSREAGTRLLDVLDVHYYTEAMGECRVSNCDDESHTSCIEARVQAVRSLWEEGYTEDSWIGQWMQHCLPIMNKLNQSVEQYYPETKISFTEYSFGGGGQPSGAVAQADALGAFGKTGVYLATLWPDANNCDYQMSAINLYTNYDGKGSSFGSESVYAETSDIEQAYAYAAVKDADASSVTLVVSNKSLTDSKYVEVTLEGSAAYTSADAYIISGDSHLISQEETAVIKNGAFIYKLPPLSVALFEIS